MYHDNNYLNCLVIVIFIVIVPGGNVPLEQLLKVYTV